MRGTCTASIVALGASLTAASVAAVRAVLRSCPHCGLLGLTALLTAFLAARSYSRRRSGIAWLRRELALMRRPRACPYR